MPRDMMSPSMLSAWKVTALPAPSDLQRLEAPALGQIRRIAG